MTTPPVLKNNTLYLIPTPIGNLEDITLRALAVLKEVDGIWAEDTRRSNVLLRHYNIQTPMKSFHSFNEHRRLGEVMAQLRQGKRMALITDAGTPAIADPGFLVVRECVKHGIEVECLPGATALIPALVKSGFPTDRFVFEGFLPHKKGKRAALERIAQEERTVVFYESPHRLVKTLQQMVEILGPERRVSVSRELTKIYEKTLTMSLQEMVAHFEKKDVKGEVVVAVEGR